MNSILRQNLAPLTQDAWKEIKQSAVDVLKPMLSARKVVDFVGPKGIDFSAINLGRIDIHQEETPEGVNWGLRKMQPLIEVRKAFELNQQDLDDISRGAVDADLEPLEEAAKDIAHFEDSAIYNGFADAGIRGIIPASAHDPISTGDSSKLAPAIAEGVQKIHQAGIKGPFALVMGDNAYQMLIKASAQQSYPLVKSIERVLQGPIVWSSAVDGAILMSTRGGDFELTVGQDISIGYASHDRKKVELYFTESFAFRVIEPAAALLIKI